MTIFDSREDVIGPMHIQCPQCASVAFKKNGYTRHGKQNHRCLDCGRQFSSENEEASVKDGPMNPIKLIEEETEILA